jgi:hypothetical protein
VPIYGGEGLLLVVKIRKTTLELIYGVPALHAWNAAREPNHRGTRSIGISTLKRLHAELPAALRMAKVRTVDRETHEVDLGVPLTTFLPRLMKARPCLGRHQPNALSTRP